MNSAAFSKRMTALALSRLPSQTRCNARIKAALLAGSAILGAQGIFAYVHNRRTFLLVLRARPLRILLICD